MESEAVLLVIKQGTRRPYAEAESDLLERAKEVGEPAFLIVQSFEHCLFTKFTGTIPDLATSFSGRIFGPQAEVRWVREGDLCRYWLLWEGNGGRPALRREQRYYLWGIWDGKRFAELRIPDYQPLAYPLDGNPAPQDRAYIRVYEYYPVPPNPWPSQAEEVEKLLNQPRLLAHRFVGLACGQEQRAKEEEDEDEEE